MGIWLQRYETLVNNDRLDTQKLKLFVSKNHATARAYRIDLVARLKLDGILLPDSKKIPTDLFLKDIGKDMKYFETKMMQEAKIEKIKGVSHE